MKKCIKKLCLCLLTVLTLIGSANISSVFASDGIVHFAKKQTWVGTKAITSKTGKVHAANNYRWVFQTTPSTSAGRFLYCIDFGTDLTTGQSYTNTTNASDLFTNAGGTTPAQKKKLISRIGARSNFERDYEADYTMSVKRFVRYLVGQTLIWEVTEGERDNDFKRATSDGSWSHVKSLWTFSDKGDYTVQDIKDYFDEIYDKWVSQIQDEIKIEAAIPSFSKETVAQATTYKLSYNASSKSYRTTLTDTNKVLSLYDKMTITNSDEQIAASIDGNKLMIETQGMILEKAPARIKLQANRSVATATVTGYIPGNYQRLVDIGDNTSISRAAYLKVFCETLATMSILKVDEDGQQVAGAQFVIGKTVKEGCVDDIVSTLTTDSEGMAKTTLNEEGTYYIQEIAVPLPYVVDSTIKEVEIASGDEKVVEFADRYIHGKVEITKVDSETGAVITQEGAQFNVLNSEKELVETIETNKEGIASTSDLRYGTYYIEEVKPPYGYVLENKLIEVVIDEDNKLYRISYPNVRTKYTLNLVKSDKDTGMSWPQGDASLIGAIYGLYAREDILDSANGSVLYEKNELVCQLIIDDECKAGIDDLYGGHYYLKELQAPLGYQLSLEEYDVDFDYDGGLNQTISLEVNVKDEVRYGFIALNKFIKDSSESEVEKGEEGIHFQVLLERYVDDYGSFEEAWNHRENFNEKEYDEMITDSEGYALSHPLVYGSFIVHQSSSGNNTSDVGDFIVAIKGESDEPVVKHYIVSNALFNTYLKITKIDEETGKVVLKPGTTYKIKALSDVVVDGREFKAGDYIYYKSYALSGLGLKLGAYKVDQWTTNNQGYVVLNEKLSAGDYLLEEVIAPDGYTKGLDVTFTISQDSVFEKDDDGNALFNVASYDKAVKGLITIEKKGDVLTSYDEKTHQFIYENKGLSEASFDIIAKEDIVDPSNDGTIIYPKGMVVDSLITDEEGKAISEPLPLGAYKVVETGAPYGFVLNKESYDVVLSYQDQQTDIVAEKVTVFNDKQNVELSVLKKDASSKELLEGAQISLCANRDILNYKGEVILKAGSEIETVTSSKDGSMTFKANLPIDMHTLKRYDLTDEIIEIIDEEGIYQETIVDVFQNEETNITLREDENGEYSLEIIHTSNKDGELVEDKEIYTINFEGYEIPQKSLFILKEIKAPDGYLDSDTIIEINTAYQDEDVPVIYLESTFENAPTVVSITKSDITGEKELEGAKLTVTDKEGHVLDQWISSKEPHFIEGMLAVGETYILSETIAPVGYATSSSIEFTIEDTGEIQRVIMKDDTTKVSISKTDITGDKELEGAHLTLSDKEGHIIDEWVSESVPHFIEGILVVGETYTLTEAIAPEGYATSSSIEFTIEDTGEIQRAIMKDDTTKVSISKTDITGDKELEGAHLTLSDKEGHIIDEWVSESVPHFIEGILVAGQAYTLTETIAPEGYVTSSSIEFTVEDSTALQMVEMIDKVVEISKEDITTGKELPGAQLTISDEEGNIVDSWISTDIAHWVSGLVEGKSYTLIEVTAPLGYECAESIEFVVSGDQVIQRIVMEDRPILTRLQVNKVDSDTKLPIDDFVEMTLYRDKEGKDVIAKKKGKKQVTFDDLTYGTYYLSETLAPKGYQLSDEVKEIIIGEQSDKMVVVEFENTKNEQVVKTNDITRMMIYCLGMVISLCYFVVRKKKED